MKIGPIAIIRTKELLALQEAIVEFHNIIDGLEKEIDEMEKEKTLRSEVAVRLLEELTFFKARLNRYENVVEDPNSLLRKSASDDNV